MEAVYFQYSGNKHKIVPGIGMVNMLWHGIESDLSVPVDYRIYDKETDGKTKNMLQYAKIC